MVLVLCLAKKKSLYAEINVVEKIQLFWEGIHLVSGVMGFCSNFRY